MNKGRPRNITLYKEGNKYLLKFYDHKGQRRNRSTGTGETTKAELLRKELEILQINKDSPVSDKAKDMYFGKEKKAPEIQKPIKKSILVDLAVYQAEIDRLQSLVDYYQPFEGKYKSLLRTIEGKMAVSEETQPTVSEALDKYLEFISHLAGYRKNYFNFVERIFKGEEGKPGISFNMKVGEVTAEQVYTYLNDDAKNNVDPESRWNRQRKQFTKFFNWACGLWVFHNPMDQVPTKKPTEKEDPEWSKLEEVNELIDKQKDIYHKAMLATLFFAGVSAHEFRGLRVQDYFELKGEWYLRVTPNECRNIKTKKRRRNIPVGETLKSYLDEYLKTHLGGPALFPPLKKKGKRDYWHEGTLSRHLNDEIFPSHIDCKWTRRTYGSLQLRDGKTFSEIAALMGNSIIMVELHYARINSSELKSNL